MILDCKIESRFLFPENESLSHRHENTHDTLQIHHDTNRHWNGSERSGRQGRRGRGARGIRLLRRLAGKSGKQPWWLLLHLTKTFLSTMPALQIRLDNVIGRHNIQGRRFVAQTPITWRRSFGWFFCNSHQLLLSLLARSLSNLCNHWNFSQCLALQARKEAQKKYSDRIIVCSRECPKNFFSHCMKPCRKRQDFAIKVNSAHVAHPTWPPGAGGERFVLCSCATISNSLSQSLNKCNMGRVLRPWSSCTSGTNPSMDLYRADNSIGGRKWISTINCLIRGMFLVSLKYSWKKGHSQPSMSILTINGFLSTWLSFWSSCKYVPCLPRHQWWNCTYSGLWWGSTVQSNVWISHEGNMPWIPSSKPKSSFEPQE